MDPSAGPRPGAPPRRRSNRAADSAFAATLMIFMLGMQTWFQVDLIHHYGFTWLRISTAVAGAFAAGIWATRLPPVRRFLDGEGLRRPRREDQVA